MGDDSYKLVLFVLHRHMPNPTPIHHAGHKVHGLVLVDR